MFLRVAFELSVVDDDLSPLLGAVEGLEVLVLARRETHELVAIRVVCLALLDFLGPLLPSLPEHRRTCYERISSWIYVWAVDVSWALG